ncbi:MAG TPA: tetraacyldisaccharide 4'-kinase [Pirellulaceae bacterium]|jgi:tetraacyldisaccharide 4'-kinase|nr:tetraacyldisaccharide 4'-kinase [Pirellulaceae bacterium]
MADGRADEPVPFWKKALDRRVTGPGWFALRSGLRAASLPYAAAMRARNAAFDSGWKESIDVGVPVISVGNLTAGGTGKTPAVCRLARELRNRNVRVGLVSRGYKAGEQGTNDEALELEERLPDVPHVQDPDRVAAARIAIDELASQVILLDDAFQHRRIRRDWDIVLIDATNPFGYGALLPAGLLREPLSSLARAQTIVLSRANMIDEEAREAIRKQVERYAPAADWVEAVHQPSGWRNAEGLTESTEIASFRRVAVVSAIGNPDAFRRTLTGLGLEVAEERIFPDHHRFTREDVASLQAWGKQLATERIGAIVCTGKDLVKLSLPALGPLPLWSLVIDFSFTRNETAIQRRLDDIAAKVPAED